MDRQIQNQHWIPKRVLLKNFADADGKVFGLDISSGTVRKRSPKFEASAPGFNEYEVNGIKISYEKKYEKIETAVAPVLRKIVQEKTTACLSSGERQKMANFIAAQSIRTEAFYKGVEGIQSREHFATVFESVWRGALFSSNEILSRPWIFMEICDDDVFYLGDHPVTLQSTEHPDVPMSLGFDVPGVEAFLPLTPKFALYLPCLSTAKEIVTGYDAAQRGLCELQNRLGIINPFLAKPYAEIALRLVKNGSDLYNAIVKGSPLIAKKENIENFNYLQCMFASSSIYSNKGDFSFAKMVFEKTPQYRELLKTHLIGL